MEKFFSTLSERVKILRKRNMTIDASSSDKLLLYKYNYYNLVNGYKDPFLYSGASTIEKYQTGTRLSELEALMIFDSNIRHIFLKEILKVEEIIKNQLVQSFYKYHLDGNPMNTLDEKKILHRDSEYLRRKYYDLSESYSQVSKDSIRGTITTTIFLSRPHGYASKLDRHSSYDNFVSTVYKTLGQQRKNKNESIKQYLEQHGYVPMWILVNVLTFGNVSHFFTFQKKDVQLDIIKSLSMSSYHPYSDDLAIINASRVFQILSLFRNTCAHNERFYTTKIKVPIDDQYMSYGKKLPHYVDGSTLRRLNPSQLKKRERAREGIYALIFSLSLFLSREEIQNLISELKKELHSLDKQLTTISLSDIERLMGLNFDWHTALFKS